VNPAFLLDTNVPSELIRPRPEPRIGQWMFAQPEESLFLSAVTIGELRKGIVLLSAGKRRNQIEQWFEDDLVARFSARILPITQLIANRWGVLSAIRQMAGTPLGMADGLIAATALEHSLTLVTRNAKDFTGLGVSLLNPWNEMA
jgi:predicted nucleic acid-binding protein